MTSRLKSLEILVVPTVRQVRKAGRKGATFKISSKDHARGPGAAADPNSKMYRDKEAIIMIKLNYSPR